VQNAVAANSESAPMMRKLLRKLTAITNVSTLTSLVPQITNALAGDAPMTDRFAAAGTLVSQARRQLAPPPTVGHLLTMQDTYLAGGYRSMLTSPVFNSVIGAVTDAAGKAFDSAAGQPTSANGTKTI